MAHRVRKGAWYRWTPDFEDVSYYDNECPTPGSLVEVVSVAGGARGGQYRNIRDRDGYICFTNIRTLTKCQNPNKFIDLIR
jgi:hypothetical protein